MTNTEDHEIAWNMIRRWKARYGLVIGTQPNGKPYIDPAEFELWWNQYQERLKTLKAQE